MLTKLIKNHNMVYRIESSAKNYEQTHLKSTCPLSIPCVNLSTNSCMCVCCHKCGNTYFQSLSVVSQLLFILHGVIHHGHCARCQAT